MAFRTQMRYTPGAYGFGRPQQTPPRYGARAAMQGQRSLRSFRGQQPQEAPQAPQAAGAPQAPQAAGGRGGPGTPPGPRVPNPFTDGTGEFMGSQGNFDVFRTPDGIAYHDIASGQIWVNGRLFASPSAPSAGQPPAGGASPTGSVQPIIEGPVGGGGFTGQYEPGAYQGATPAPGGGGFTGQYEPGAYQGAAPAGGLPPPGTPITWLTPENSGPQNAQEFAGAVFVGTDGAGNPLVRFADGTTEPVAPEVFEQMSPGAPRAPGAPSDVAPPPEAAQPYQPMPSYTPPPPPPSDPYGTTTLPYYEQQQTAPAPVAPPPTTQPVGFMGMPAPRAPAPAPAYVPPPTSYQQPMVDPGAYTAPAPEVPQAAPVADWGTASVDPGMWVPPSTMDWGPLFEEMGPSPFLLPPSYEAPQAEEAYGPPGDLFVV